MRLLATILCLLLLPTYGAAASCDGRSLLEPMRTLQPEIYARMMANAAEVPNGTGRLWEISDGDSEPSYLFGTYHTQQARRAVPPAVWPAMESARTVIFEMSLEEQETMQRRMQSDPDFTHDMRSPALNDRLGPEQLAAISAALALRGIPMESVQHLRPWLLFSILSFPACQLQAVAEGAKPLDRLMAERARARNIPEIGLETHEEGLAAFERIRPARFLEMMVSTADAAEREEDIFETMLDLYAGGQIAAIGEFSILIAEDNPFVEDPRAVYDEVLYELLEVRNRQWMPRLVQELRFGNAFIAVGALHLPGEAGLIELLRAEGYTVTRVYE